MNESNGYMNVLENRTRLGRPTPDSKNHEKKNHKNSLGYCCCSPFSCWRSTTASASRHMPKGRRSSQSKGSPDTPSRYSIATRQAPTTFRERGPRLSLQAQVSVSKIMQRSWPTTSRRKTNSASNRRCRRPHPLQRLKDDSS